MCVIFHNERKETLVICNVVVVCVCVCVIFFKKAHLKKCFEGIKKLVMEGPSLAEGRKAYQTTGIISPDGEHLPLMAPITLDGRPEEWLNWVSSSSTQSIPFAYINYVFFLCKHRCYKKGEWVGECIPNHLK